MNVGRYLRGEDRHVGTSRVDKSNQPAFSARQMREMKDTNQLPEPELGYIQTDKSNQPAFSARQMREAMKHAQRPERVPMTEDAALLGFMAEHRVGVMPEHEGPWCAYRYDDEPQFVVEAEGDTPRDALRALFNAHHGITAQPKKEGA